jgi:hypothetical protein
MSVTKSTAETYDIVNGTSKATITLRAWSHEASKSFRGQIQIQSSFGNWANSWNACGIPFKDFLVGCDFDYLFGKFAPESLHVFDGDGSLRQLRADILTLRREGRSDRDEIRALWDALRDSEPRVTSSVQDWVGELSTVLLNLRESDSSPGRPVLKRWRPEYDLLTEPWLRTQTIYNPMLQRFWTDIWTEFKETLKSEIDAPAEDLTPTPS